MRYRWDPPYPAYRSRAGVGPDAGIRASDAERNDVADKLSRHYADGRLDQIEFKSRLDRAVGATTRGDLGGLFDDLPPLSDEAQPSHRRRRRLLPLILIILIAVAVQSAMWSFHTPWLLLAIVGLFLWRRAGWHGHSNDSHHHSESDR
jgi:hypothetical protein